MKNDEFINTHNNHLEDIIKTENDTLLGIKEIWKLIVGNSKDIEIPAPSTTIADKMNKLFEVFQYDDTPLDQHLTVLLETNYLFSKSALLSIDIQTFFNELVLAANKNDQKKLEELFNSASSKEEEWNRIDSELDSFDLKNNLKDVIDSGIKLPQNLYVATINAIARKTSKSVEEVISQDKEEIEKLAKRLAYDICTEEINKIEYVPEEPHVNKRSR